MEQNLLWSRTALSSLKVMGGVNRHYDRLIRHRAGKVTGINPECQSDFDNTYKQVDKILSYIDVKRRALELVGICNEVLSRLLPAYRRALILKFKYNKSAGEIERILKCTIRTFFRHVNEGLKKFDEVKNLLGYTDEYLTEKYGRDSWLTNLKIKVEEEEGARLKKKIANEKKPSGQIVQEKTAEPITAQPTSETAQPAPENDCCESEESGESGGTNPDTGEVDTDKAA